MFLAWASLFMFARRLMHRRRKPRIPAPAAASTGDHKFLIRLGKLESPLPAFVVIDNRAHGDFQKYVAAIASGLVRSFAVTPPPRPVFGIETEMHKGVVPLARLHNDVAALAPVTARRSTARDELLAPEGHAAIPAIPRLHLNLRLINKHACPIRLNLSSGNMAHLSNGALG